MRKISIPTQKTVNRFAADRLQNELAEWLMDPPAGFNPRVTDNLQTWIIEVQGAPGTLYADEQYQLQLNFPDNYPMSAPHVIFIQSPPMHPHIYGNGHICLDILYESWSPALTVSSICISILSMLSSATKKVPPPDNDKYMDIYELARKAGRRRNPIGDFVMTKCNPFVNCLAVWRFRNRKG